MKRNLCPHDDRYRAEKADSRAHVRRSSSRRNQQFGGQEFDQVDALLTEKLSPEQIAGRLRYKNRLAISHETIYRHVWKDWHRGGSLYKNLRSAQKKRRKRYRAYDSRGRLANKRHISERPASVEERKTIGHWEIDTVMGKVTQDCIVTLVERKTGYALIGKLKNRTNAELNKRATLLIQQRGLPFKTITSDNGTEFHGYKEIEKATGVKFYFANPYHSWERGSNENLNGLIRQYLPRGKTMAGLTQMHCNWIAKQLNNRPRKRHGYRTPEECMYGT
jgi:IS30 family transposase